MSKKSGQKVSKSDQHASLTSSKRSRNAKHALQRWSLKDPTLPLLFFEMSTDYFPKATAGDRGNHFGMWIWKRPRTTAQQCSATCSSNSSGQSKQCTKWLFNLLETGQNGAFCIDISVCCKKNLNKKESIGIQYHLKRYKLNDIV